MNSMTECEAIVNLKNLFSNYELTLPNTDSLETLQFTIKALEEVREYRKLEEQGLLIRLPCKVGDTVYEASHFWNSVIERNVAFVVICKNSIYVKNGCGDSFEFGEEVFLTKEEAEAALERMKG